MFSAMTRRTLLALSMLCLSPYMNAGAAQAAQCDTEDTITIAEMTWLSASTFAYVTERVLADGYGCDVKIVPGDTVPTATSMLTKSEPHIAPELWVSTAESIWEEALEKGNVYKASDIFADGGKEGWWIPDYVAEQNPGLKSVTDLKDHAGLFREAASGDQGRFYGCPPGWGCEIITNNLFKALDLESHGWELFSPGSGANLKASIARKVTRNEPIVGYYWGPTAVIGKYNLVRLEMPEYDPEKFNCLTDKNCADPQLTGWKTGEVAVAVVSELKEKAPNVAAFLENLQFPNDTVNALLAWGDDNSASPEEVADRFFQQHPEIWQQWVPDDVAERIQASL
ncbi:MAG TPA: ABC transporter substrate-binding protein [Arenicellales bacterium]|nr:ABC transporter substrate-binding protein [Arenicellales bacterium]